MVIARCLESKSAASDDITLDYTEKFTYSSFYVTSPQYFLLPLSSRSDHAIVTERRSSPRQNVYYARSITAIVIIMVQRWWNRIEKHQLHSRIQLKIIYYQPQMYFVSMKLKMRLPHR